MTASLPRRQAARLGELLGRRPVGGLVCVEGAPRRGKSDLLLQLHRALVERRGPAPALLRLGHGPLPADAARTVASQLLPFLEAGDARRAKAGNLDTARLAEREDFAAWKEFLSESGEQSANAARFFTAVARLAETIGPICLLLDDAGRETLAAAAPAASNALTVLAAVPEGEAPRCARQVIQLEPFSVRESVLLAEGLARRLDVRFCGEAAAPFAAYCGSDPFALSSVVQEAALSGRALDSPRAFVAAYLDDLRHGTLRAFFRASVPGSPGSLERRFALEWLMGDETGVLDRWRGRLLLDEVLARMRRSGFAAAGVPGWPAARDWAFLESAAPAAADREAGRLATRLLCEMEAAACREDAGRLRHRIAAALGAAVPAAAFSSRLRFRKVCHIACEPLPAGELFLCYGFTGAPPTADSAALLAVALLDEQARLARALDEIEKRLPAAAPFEICATEKWVVMKRVEPEDAELGEARGARLLDSIPSTGSWRRQPGRKRKRGGRPCFGCPPVPTRSSRPCACSIICWSGPAAIRAPPRRRAPR